MTLEYRFLFGAWYKSRWLEDGRIRQICVGKTRQIIAIGRRNRFVVVYKKKYRNFILNVDRKTQSKKDNSGIFVRFADPGDETDSGSIEIGLIIDSIRKLIFPKIMSQS